MQEKAEEAAAELKALKMEVAWRVIEAIKDDLASGRIVRAFTCIYILFVCVFL